MENTSNQSLQTETFIRFSDSGRILQIYNEENGQLIAEILVHGFLKRAVESSSNEGNYIFRGELTQLAAFEYLDIITESITERSN